MNLSATYPGVLFKLSSATVAIIDNDGKLQLIRNIEILHNIIITKVIRYKLYRRRNN